MKWEEYVKGYKYVKLFLKAEPKVGKTFLCASASRLGKTLYVDAEGGLITARNIINKDNLDIEVIPTTETGKCAESIANALDKALSGDYDWVIFDSISEMSEQLAMHHTKDTENPDWMKITNSVKKLGRYLRDGHFNCIVTALCNPKGEVVMPGKTKISVPSFYNTCSMIQKQKIGKSEIFYLVSGGTGEHGIGDRFGIFDEREEIPKDHPEIVLQKLVDGIAKI